MGPRCDDRCCDAAVNIYSPPHRPPTPNSDLPSRWCPHSALSPIRCATPHVAIIP
ncbi:unnamed protein product [Trichogramma brassicae]|uniref:Uncharacterized protein n=1 Tax=Trichogramma brassicae TaxID=86971 RepID=A0A6H5ID27_9HYME|nr:unnamed protein product [Trichogramma brassicae]